MGGRAQQQPEVAVTRLPKATDPSLRQAQMRAQEARTRGSGRLSTILTDTLRNLVGSFGKLGA